MLEAAGYEVFLASSGAEGVNSANGCAVDLVVLDYEMPGMNGTEVARCLRATHPALPIIMVSGAEPEQTPRIVDLFIPKTNMATTLVEEVDRFLSHHGPTGSVTSSKPLKSSTNETAAFERRAKGLDSNGVQRTTGDSNKLALKGE
jgi:CheY-like chemotaxis protein